MNQNSQPPTVDDRTQGELNAELTALADQYIDDWNPESDDMVDQLLAVGAGFGEELIQRLNKLPQKHRAAFLETLGKQPQPPQAARLPLSVEPAGEIDRNVQINEGTQVIAETRDDETTVFEIPPDSGFEATPASLAEVYAVDPDRDRLTSHEPLASGETQQLFVGENHQQHALYLGDTSLFELDSRAIIEIELAGQIVDGFAESVVWEYYGTKYGANGGCENRGADGTTNGEKQTETDETLGEGWHRLPPAKTQRSTHEQPDQSSTDETTIYTTRRQLPGEFVETTVGETQSRWLRCRMITPSEKHSQPSACFDTEIEQVSVSTSMPHDSEQLRPNKAFVDDVPLAVDSPEDIEPLGQFPQPSSTLYLASDEALSKPGAQVQLSFEPPADPYGPQQRTETAVDQPADDDKTTVDQTDDNQTTDGDQPTDSDQTAADPDHQLADFGTLDEPPALSWEYWNGAGWSRLAVDDETARLQQPGDLSFVVPEDIEPTGVAGHEARWIRGRLVSGSYGDLSATLTADTAVAPDRPRFSAITVEYDHSGSNVSQLVVENNGQLEVWSTVDSEPFDPLPDDAQTVYFGFDGPLQHGPIPIFIPLIEIGYPAGFDPSVQWEYCVEPETDTWRRPTVEDGTSGLTERGIVRLGFSEPTQPTDRFGTTRHWIRAIITEDRFENPNVRAGTRSEQSTDQPMESTDQSTTASPPTIEGVYPNTQWADNARTVETEILGSSDGSANQQFECAHGPLLSCELWVDESKALSDDEVTTLRETQPDRLDVVTDSRGNRTAVWVRWQAVDRLSEDDTRVCRVDRTDGTIQFGDGDCGKIPPRGIDSIRVTYRTGGGPAGNVSAGAVETLKTPISLVESVTNPFGGAGGSPIEATPAVAERAAGELQNRGRAVTPRDYEQLATSAVRNLARVTCQPNRGPTGDRQPGSVRLVVVPDENRKRPTPSLAVKTQLKKTLSEVAPARLTERSQSTLSVCGPSYVPCDVTVTLSVDRGSRSRLNDETEATLAAFLHPIEGNGGTGWAFGEAPTRTAISRRLQTLEGVVGVRRLSATLSVDGERRPLGAQPQPPLPEDGLVCSGSHRITLEVPDES